MTSFVVLEVKANIWTDEVVSAKVVMQSCSEVLCYSQALALQTEAINEEGGPYWWSYKVVPEEEFDV